MPAGSASDIQRLFIAALLAAGSATACKQTHVVLESSADGGADDTDGSGGPDGPADADGPGGAGGAAGTGGTIVSASYYHACAIAGGALYCWGRNDDGRLGVGDTDPHSTPTRVGDGTDWADIQVAEVSALGRKQDGTIWAFGNNGNGQLGQGDFKPRTKPTQIGTRTDWIAIATRFDHACALRADRTLWCWGKGEEGQLGQDETSADGIDRPTPTQVMTWTDVAMVDTGQGHTCAIRLGGTLWCWGRNTNSVLGLGPGPGMPKQIRHPVQVGSATDWQLVRSGQTASCGLRGGRVYCWGEVIDDSQPGSPAGTDVSTPTAIGGPTGAVGLTFNTFGGCSFDPQGAGACWGRNAEGQLGLGDENARHDVVPLPLKGWTWLSAGRFSTCGVRGDRVSCTGDNTYGQIGLGSVTRVLGFRELDL